MILFEKTFDRLFVSDVEFVMALMIDPDKIRTALSSYIVKHGKHDAVSQFDSFPPEIKALIQDTLATELNKAAQSHG
jgi:acyl CoA:acetate/3-ketoacid CoA transferase alpha subunit